MKAGGDIIGSNDSYISFGGQVNGNTYGIWMYGGIAVKNGDLYVDSETHLNGKTDIKGDFHYKSNIYCYTNKGDAKIGKTGTFKTSNWLGGSIELQFINGIMVGSSSGGKESADLEGAALPSVSGHNGDVLVATNDSAVWKKLNASLVNFSDTTVTPPTDGSGVYKVSIPYTKVTSSSTTAYTSGHNVTVYANKALPDGYRIGGYEDKGSNWVEVGKVWASGEAYTKTTTSSTQSSVSGKVKVTVSTS